MIACKSSKVSQVAPKENYFKVEVVQNGEIQKEKKGIITLKKEPFTFKLTYYKTDLIYVSSSWGTYYYDYPSDKNIFECSDDYLKGCRFVAGKTSNEDIFNINKDINVAGEDYHCVWFYDENMDWYRMDKSVEVKDRIIYAAVTVENIYDLDKKLEVNSKESEYSYPISKINQDLYMVFATEVKEKGMKHPKELQREKFILRFK